jgi:cytochrome c biogenesis protein
MKRSLALFSSLRLAIFLLILLTAASVLGTLIPQGRTFEEYAARYGGLAPLVLHLQLNSLYHSTWFLVLLGLFALNIVVCTLTRLGPKVRRARSPRVEVEPKSLEAFKIRDRVKMKIPAAGAKDELQKFLGDAGYRTRETTRDGRIHILARKRVLGLFGSDAVHVGLLIIITGGLVSGMSGFREDLSLVKGQGRTVPRSEFSIRLDDFMTEYYPGGSVKAWKSALTILEKTEPVLSKTIEVNRPLSYKGVSFFQASYGWDWDKTSLEIWARKKNDPASLKKFMVRVGERRELVDGERTVLSVTKFFPDFVLGAGNEPQTRSNEPNNPAALIEGYRGDKFFSGWVFANYPDFSQTHGTEDSGLAFELKKFEAEPVSVIEVVSDPGAILIWIGCVLVMAGLGLAFYWPTWEIRVLLEEIQGQTDLVAGGSATKSRDRFAAEFSRLGAALRRNR